MLPHDNSIDAFLAGEYRNLWKDHGLEEIPLLRRKRTARATVFSAPTSLEGVREWIGDCRRCGLCEGRKKIVFGSGNPKARLMFIGEGPGADEDQQGVPFVGQAGQLLNKIIEAMGANRDQVYIANVVKCRPPENRTPAENEVAQCLPFLSAQIAIIRPTIIVALGGSATNALLGGKAPLSAMRGRFQALPNTPEIKVMPTFHPAYLLRTPAAKKTVWEDMKLVMSHLESTT